MFPDFILYLIQIKIYKMFPDFILYLFALITSSSCFSKVQIVALILIDHYFVNESVLVNLSSNDLFTTLPCAGNCETLPSWTFSTVSDLKIRITFSQFRFVDGNGYLEIGDGKVIRKASRLAHFTGSNLPDYVTSVTNAAWIKVHAACGINSATFSMSVTAVRDEGTLH